MATPTTVPVRTLYPTALRTVGGSESGIHSQTHAARYSRYFHVHHFFMAEVMATRSYPVFKEARGTHGINPIGLALPPDQARYWPFQMASGY